MRIVRSIQINPDSVDLAYMDDGDVRMKGTVFMTHHLSVNRGSNYDQEIDDLEAAADALVTDVLTDWTTSPAYDMTADYRHEYDDDDEDEDEE